MENLVWFRQIGSWPSALPKSEISSHSRSASYRRWEISRNGGKSLIPAPSLLHCSTGGECNGRDRAQVIWMFAELNSKCVSRESRIRISFKVVLLLAIQENE